MCSGKNILNVRLWFYKGSYTDRSYLQSGGHIWQVSYEKKHILNPAWHIRTVCQELFMHYVDMQGHKICKVGCRQTLDSWVTVCSHCFGSLWCKDGNESPAFYFLGQIHHLKVQTLLNLYNQRREIGLQPVLKTHKTSLTIQNVYYMNSSKYCPASGKKCKYSMSHKKFKVNSC